MIIAWMSIRRNGNGKYETETLRKQEMSVRKVIHEIIRIMEVLKYEKFDKYEGAILLMKTDPKNDGNHSLVAIGGLPDELTAVITDYRIKKYLPKAP